MRLEEAGRRERPGPERAGLVGLDWSFGFCLEGHGELWRVQSGRMT